MNLKRVGKLFGLGLALALMVLAAGNQGQVGLAQAGCTVTLNPGQSIQEAIDKAEAGAVICLAEGTWEENLKIERSLTLRGAGKEKTIIKGKEDYKPVILIESDSEIEIILEGLTIAEAKGWGIEVRGKVKVTIKDSTVSGNRWDGLDVRGSANVSLENSTVSGNGYEGLHVEDSANVSLENSTVSGNGYEGLDVGDSANMILVNSTVSGNGGGGLSVWGSANMILVNSTVSGNRDGILVVDKSQTAIINSIISNNPDWGVAAWLKKCGYPWDEFTGKVIFLGNNQIYGNGQGDVCLP